MSSSRSLSISLSSSMSLTSPLDFVDGEFQTARPSICSAPGQIRAGPSYVLWRLRIFVRIRDRNFIRKAVWIRLFDRRFRIPWRQVRRRRLGYWLRLTAGSAFSSPLSMRGRHPSFGTIPTVRDCSGAGNRGEARNPLVDRGFDPNISKSKSQERAHAQTSGLWQIRSLRPSRLGPPRLGRTSATATLTTMDPSAAVGRAAASMRMSSRVAPTTRARCHGRPGATAAAKANANAGATTTTIAGGRERYFRDYHGPGYGHRGEGRYRGLWRLRRNARLSPRSRFSRSRQRRGRFLVR
jgi:hypothetical protein